MKKTTVVLEVRSEVCISVAVCVCIGTRCHRHAFSHVYSMYCKGVSINISGTND
jgi:hypothetical protein